MSQELIKQLIEKRAGAWEQAKAILDKAAEEKRDLTAEEETAFQKANSDLDAIDARRKEIESAEQRNADTEAALENILKRRQEADQFTPANDPDIAAREFFSGKTGKRSFEVRAEKPMGTEEFRALSKLTAGAGANTVKTSFYDRLVAHLIEVAGLMKAGPTVLQTTSGEQIQIPKTTGHSTAALVAEAGTIGASDPVFGQVPLDAYKYAFLVQVSNELVTDTSVDLLGYLAMQAGRALGNALGTAFITGTGSSQPQGIVPVATLGVTFTSGLAGSFNYSNLVDLQYSVIQPYRDSQSCAWLMKDATLGNVRKVLDSQNRPIWEPSMQVGAPDTILGKPVYADPNVATVALSAKSVLFGDFSQYYVRLVNGVRFERSDDFAFSTDLVTYRAILRGDGDLVDVTGAVKYGIGNAA